MKPAHTISEIEGVSLRTIAEEVGTPVYVYSRAAIVRNWRAFREHFSPQHLICYAVKANGNLSILSLLAELGAGFDIVSAGELHSVLRAGGNPAQIIFSGVGKTAAEMQTAIAQRIFCFNVESSAELARLDQLANAAGTVVNVALRMNPDIDAKTHHHIATGRKHNKFGIESEAMHAMLNDMAQRPSVRLVGLACHIGSQITQLAPFEQALKYLLRLYHKLQGAGHPITYLNVGGGLGIQYQHESPPAIAHYAQALQQILGDLSVKLIVEPGRALIGNAGVLLTRIEYLKKMAHKNFAIVDAGMNDFMRPALYDAWHHVLAVSARSGAATCYDIVGPVCESADYLAKDRSLCVEDGDLLVIDNCGAYGASMSSNYNARGRAAAVLVDGDRFKIIRRRETIEDLLHCETQI